MTDTSEPVSQTEAERRAALAALVVGADVTTEAPAEPVVVRTGREVYSGGDVARLLVKRASSLGYVEGGIYQRCEAVPGDVVLLTQKQADRLDSLGATVEPDADLGEVAEAAADGLWTEEQIRQAKAGELVAYVTQHPEERAKVRAVEEERPEEGKEKRRVSVLNATEPTPEADEAAAAEAAARAAAAAEGGQGDGDDPPPAE